MNNTIRYHFQVSKPLVLFLTSYLKYCKYVAEWRTILSSCRELQNFAEEEQNVDVIEEPTDHPGKDFILSFRCIFAGKLVSFVFVTLQTSSWRRTRSRSRPHRLHLQVPNQRSPLNRILSQNQNLAQKLRRIICKQNL